MGDELRDFMEKFKAVCIPARTPTAECKAKERFSRIEADKYTPVSLSRPHLHLSWERTGLN